MLSLITLKGYFEQKSLATVKQICEYFKAKEQEVMPLIDYFIGKGYVRSRSLTPACSKGCGACPQVCHELYCWCRRSN